MNISQWLIEYGYCYILSLHFGLLLIVTIVALANIMKKWAAKEWVAFASLFVLIGFLLNMQPYFQAHVYNDEFYYASIGQNIAQNGRTCPLVYVDNTDTVAKFNYFQPPYPQGWPYLIGAFHKLFFSYVGSLNAWPIWYQAALLNKLLLVCSIAGLFIVLRCLYPLPSAWTVGLSVAFLPFLLHLAQGASAELASLSALVLTVLAYISCKRSPNWLHCLWLTLSAAYLVQMRPEGAIALGLAIFVFGSLGSCNNFAEFMAAYGKKAAVMVLVFSFCSWSAFWAVLDHAPQLDHHFAALARPGLTIWQNRAFNLFNDAMFFLKNRGWPLALTILAVIALVNNFNKNKFTQPILNWWWQLGEKVAEPAADVAWKAALWLFLMTIFLAWYPFGDYACIYSLDSWRFAYIVVVPMAVLAAQGFTYLWSQNIKLRLVACGLVMASLATYWWPNFNYNNPMQPSYDYFLQNAVQTAAYNGVPLVLPDSHLFCSAVYRWGGQAYVVQGLAKNNKDELLKWKSSWPSDCGCMVVCLYPDSTGTYDLNLWKNWKICLLNEEPSSGAGLFLLQKEP